DLARTNQGNRALMVAGLNDLAKKPTGPAPPHELIACDPVPRMRLWFVIRPGAATQVGERLKGPFPADDYIREVDGSISVPIPVQHRCDQRLQVHIVAARTLYICQSADERGIDCIH